MGKASFPISLNILCPVFKLEVIFYVKPEPFLLLLLYKEGIKTSVGLVS